MANNRLRANDRWVKGLVVVDHNVDLVFGFCVPEVFDLDALHRLLEIIKASLCFHL